MMTPAGYLINHKDGYRLGTRGVAYDYVMAGNGLWIEAEGKLLAARVLVRPAEVRGLAPESPALRLRYGPVPEHLWNLALDVMLADPRREQYVAITEEEGGYRISLPEQDRSAAGITNIQLPGNRIMDLHSHPGMSAFFSVTDDCDEQGFQIYVVVGRLLDNPVVKLRVGVYGYFQDIRWTDVFAGDLVGVTDALDVPPVTTKDDDLEEIYADWWLPSGLARLLGKLEWVDPVEKEDFLRMTGVTDA